MITLDMILDKCEVYIKSLNEKKDKNEFELQYYEVALDIRCLLIRLKKKELEKIPDFFYMNLIDSFDIYSEFWKDFRMFEDSNPGYFE